MIPFIRLFPDGHRAVQEVIRPFDIQSIAERFILVGGRYCCGVMDDGQAKLTAVLGIDDKTHEIAVELCDNGPAILDATDRLIRNSVKHIDFVPVAANAA